MYCTMKGPIIPSRLQAVLWSTDIKHLDIVKDKGYIIHQIFAYGGWEDLLWVLEIYTKSEIINTFTATPFKDYREKRFLFVKNFILGLKNRQMNELRYVKNIPRDIRYR